MEEKRSCTVESCGVVAQVHTRTIIFSWLVGVLIAFLVIDAGAGVAALSKTADNRQKIKECMVKLDKLEGIYEAIKRIELAVNKKGGGNDSITKGR